jgi:hypothetical protein
LGAVLDAVADTWRAETPLGSPPVSHKVKWPGGDESLGRGRSWNPQPFSSRQVIRLGEPAIPDADHSPFGNALLQIAPGWRSGRSPLASWTTRPRKTWPKRPLPWPTRRNPMHRNGFQTIPTTEIAKRKRPGPPR